MSDVAAGSSAALQLQQNMAAAPDVQQQQALAVQQQQENLQKTKLSNLVTETGVKTDAEIRTKMQALVKDKGYVEASPSDQILKMASLYGQEGRTEEMAKLLETAKSTELKEIQTKLKQQEANGLTIGNAYASIKDASPEKFNEILNNMPEGQRKAIETNIPGFFKENDPKLQKAQLEALFQNTSGHNLLATNQMRVQLGEMQAEWKKEHDKVLQTIAEGKRSGSGTKEELKEYNSYNRQSRGIDIDTKKELQDAEAKYKKASEEDNKKSYGIFHWGGGGPSAKESAASAEEKAGLASTKAWQELQEVKRNIIERKLNALEGLPEGKEKDRLYDNLMKQLESTQQELPPEKSKDAGKPSGAPAASTPPAPAKTAAGVPSNKPEEALKVESGQPALPKKTPQQYAAEVNKDKDYTPDQKKAFIDRYTSGYNQIKKQEENLLAKAKADPTMTGNKFGRYIDGKGVEVFDSKGKLIGHYN